MESQQLEVPKCCPHILDIVEAGHPTLRQSARELSLEEIPSPKIQDLIQNMTATMRAAPGVGLAAPQIGESLQIVVIEDVYCSLLTSEQLLERDRQGIAYHVIINPHLFIEETETMQFFEGCLSLPNLMAIVPRAKAVRVECLNERGESVVICAKGWNARILQHEIDHLNGTLFIDRARISTLMTEENYVKLWKTKPIEQTLAALLPEG